MAASATIAKIKTDLRISHSYLDTDLSDTIDSCLADLTMCGVKQPNETDTLVLNAIKLFCRSSYCDDNAKSQAYFDRYNSLKASLMMAEGYGAPVEPMIEEIED